MHWDGVGIAPGDILLPDERADWSAFAVIACDQHTSEPDYWTEAETIVGDKPSALRLILPEIDLADAAARVPDIHRAMRRYLQDGLLQTRVKDGFVLTVRQTRRGPRPGLIAGLDLEQYSYLEGARSLIRATEGTIQDRLPPRVTIRQNAPLELPHILVLLDDPAQTVIEPIYHKCATLERLYDFQLMLGGGEVSGYAVTAANDLSGVRDALYALKEHAAFLFAVGDGNHSLAAAKTLWERIKTHLSETERQNHPARRVLAEVVNIRSDAIAFEPIHRLMTCSSPDTLLAKLCPAQPGRHLFTVLTARGSGTYSLPCPDAALPVGTLQAFLDEWLTDHPDTQIDYIHGEETLCSLAGQHGAAGFLLPPLEKSELFSAVEKDGALPRKTFSMGEAHEKRYYLEARALIPHLKSKLIADIKEMDP
jgi:hypothetical protein